MWQYAALGSRRKPQLASATASRPPEHLADKIHSKIGELLAQGGATVEEFEPRVMIPVRIDDRYISDVVVRSGAKLDASLIELRPHSLALAARADGVSEHVAPHQVALVPP